MAIEALLGQTTRSDIHQMAIALGKTAGSAGFSLVNTYFLDDASTNVMIIEPVYDVRWPSVRITAKPP